MEIKILKADLARGLRLAAGIAPRKPTVPILADVLLRASAGKLLVAATDLNVSLSAEVQCTVTKPGSIALNADDLRRFVTGAAGDEVSIMVDGSVWADIRIGRAKYRIAGHSDRDFPKIPEPSKAAGYADVDAEALHDMLARASYAASQDETPGALCGVLLGVEPERVTAATSDGHRLVEIARKIVMPKPVGGRVSLTARGAAEFAKLIDGAKTCRVAFDGRRMFVSVDGITISAGLLDFAIPPYEKAIPQSHKATATLSRDRLIDAIKRVAPLTDELHGVVFTSTDTGLRLAATSADGEELSDETDAEIKGEIRIAAHAKYVLEALSHMTGDAVTIRVIDALDPMVFVDHGDAGYTGVVMPMRLD